MESIAYHMKGMDAEEAIGFWEETAKRAAIAKLIADGEENEAVMHPPAECKNAEQRKAFAELQSERSRKVAVLNEIEAQAAFMMVRRITWRDSAANAEGRSGAPAGRASAGFVEADDLLPPEWGE